MTMTEQPTTTTHTESGLTGSWECQASDLGTTLHNVCLFASKDDLRPILTCIRITIHRDILTVTATDSYVLGEQSLPVTGSDTDNVGPTINLPAKKLADVVKALLRKRSYPASATITLDERSATFSCDGASFTIGGYEGDFPRTESLWPGSEAPCNLTSNGIRLTSLRLAKFAKVKTESSALTYRFTDDSRPVLVTDPGSTFRGLLMPERF